ncbi:MAG TPA: AarF/ABC1/UbiB kinase family protein [Deltaproteobacteria bacterium]|nr:AarF/ABC1/UbiB kinase family protein [Deltaproteobacteria bacterium]
MFIGKIGIVSRTYRHINRYRQILTILFKYGFGDLVDRLNVGQYLEIGMQMISRKRREQMDSLTREERIRMALEDLGPTFVKLGQILSTRPDLVPVSLIHELSKLQDEVPPFPASQAKSIIESELSMTVAEIFERFESVTYAAASIGQVHRARLRTGEEVIVKVQRPDITRMIEVDLEILLHLATLVERHVEDWEFYRPTRIVEEFARVIEKEIDYTVEASYAERFARQFIGNDMIYIPRIFREFSTQRILTMEYVPGIKVSDINRLDTEGYDRKIIADRGADLLLHQVFTFGFFHADPHPGNVFILPDNIICYLDFGMMGSVDRQSREDIADMVYALVERNESGVVDAFLRIVEWEEEPDRRALETDMSNFMELYLYKSLKDIRIEAVLQQLLDLITRYRLILPFDRFLMMKALSTMEGLGLMLNPDFDMTEKVAPFIRRLKMARLSPRRMFSEFLQTSGEVAQLLRIIPGELRDILKQIKQGKVRVGFEHRGLERFIFEMDRSSNRIAFALIVSSLIIGSSLIINTDIGPFLFGLPILGLLGFSMAGVLGLWLLIAIIRSGRI